MKSSYLHIPRWVALVLLVTALVGGGILAIGLKDWSGHEVFGASSRGEYPHFEGSEAEAEPVSVFQ